MNILQYRRSFLFLATICCSLFTFALKPDTTVTYTFKAPYFITQTGVGGDWEIVPELLEKGDTATALVEMERIEYMCSRKYKSPLKHYEWLAVKAEIYAKYFNDWENACNIQMEACNVLPLKDKYAWYRCRAFMLLHVYEYKLGELYLAYVSAFLAEAISSLEEEAKVLRTFAVDCMMRSYFSLEKYKEALSCASAYQRLIYDNYINYYENIKGEKYPDSYSYTLDKFADATNYVIDCELELGYIYDAEKNLLLLDSIVQTHNSRALFSNDSIFKYGEEDYSFHNRIELLFKKGEYEEAYKLLEDYDSDLFIIDWFFDGIKNDGRKERNHAKLLYLQGEKEEALSNYWEIFKDLSSVNPNHPDIARIFYEIVLNEKTLEGEYSEFTLGMLYAAYDILLSSNNRESLQFAKTLQLIIENDLELNSGRLTKHLWSEWVMKASLIYLKYLQEQFTRSTSNERLHIWDNGPYKEWFENLLPRLVCENNDLAVNDSIINFAYHGVQITKNIQLHSERRINKMITDSEDENLKEKYEKYRSLRNELLNCYEEGKIENTDNLCKEISELENDIISQLDLSDDLVYKDAWAINNSYVDSIQVGNVYVDFVRYTSSQSLTTYGAMIAMNHNDRSVLLCVDLFTEEKLDSISRENYYTTNEMYELVWGKLSNLFDNIEARNIYFAPIGDLHKIAIENVPDEYGVSIGDKYNVYRVTSTKNAIINRSSEYKIKHAKMAIFGGMDYNSDDIAQYRDAMGMLRYSSPEIGNIYKNLPKDISCIKYEGKDATESRFKEMNTSELNILHISSHGFYWDKGVQYGNNDPISKHIGKRKGDFTFEDMNMARSVLLFSPEFEDSKEDGFVLANEVAEMDFTNLDLVTLSACRTALGDLSSEGLLGLQRGFKKAGANSLLVSLDVVHDHATYLLMTEFYRNLFLGHSKRVSLQKAQQYVRTYYESPEYWCPFILIDALD